MRIANGPDPTHSKPTHSNPTHSDRDDAPDRDSIEPAGRTRLIELSLTQLMGGALAAGTAAVLGSRLGLAGTISGAVVVSLLTAIAAAVYTASLRHGRDRVRAVVAGTRVAPRRVRLAAVGAGALAVLGGGFAVITGFELLSGHALSGGGGTTVQQLSGDQSGRWSSTSTTPTPAGPSAATSTSAAPTTDTSPAPTTTVTVTARPTPTPSTSTSGAPTTTGSAEATP